MGHIVSVSRLIAVAQINLYFPAILQSLRIAIIRAVVTMFNVLLPSLQEKAG